MIGKLHDKCVKDAIHMPVVVARWVGDAHTRPGDRIYWGKILHVSRPNEFVAASTWSHVQAELLLYLTSEADGPWDGILDPWLPADTDIRRHYVLILVHPDSIARPVEYAWEMEGIR